MRAHMQGEAVRTCIRDMCMYVFKGKSGSATHVPPYGECRGVGRRRRTLHATHNGVDTLLGSRRCRGCTPTAVLACTCTALATGSLAGATGASALRVLCTREGRGGCVQTAFELFVSGTAGGRSGSCGRGDVSICVTATYLVLCLVRCHPWPAAVAAVGWPGMCVDTHGLYMQQQHVLAVRACNNVPHTIMLSPPWHVTCLIISRHHPLGHKPTACPCTNERTQGSAIASSVARAMHNFSESAHHPNLGAPLGGGGESLTWPLHGAFGPSPAATMQSQGLSGKHTLQTNVLLRMLLSLCAQLC